MSVISIFLMVIGLLVIVAAAVVAVFYLANKHEIKAEQVRVQAAIRAWNIAQAEHATDQAIRQMTRNAVDNMMQAARQHPEDRRW